MPTIVEIPDSFTKELNRLVRKYPSVLIEIEGLIVQLKQDERLGDLIPNVGYEVYKVRIKNTSANRGKSGGFRVIYYVRLADNVVMLTIYSKTEQNDITPNDIRQRLNQIISPDDGDEDLSS
jgi:mRNA-degrading endonuclease RelE of RelBE toxin-antitoxin system